MEHLLSAYSSLEIVRKREPLIRPFTEVTGWGVGRGVGRKNVTEDPTASRGLSQR